MHHDVREMKFNFILNTDGTGYWSDVCKEVQATKIKLDISSMDEQYGELRVYFDTATWDVNEDGLIYTDDQFMDDLRGCLEVLELNDVDVGYSEQGMQGKDFVSLDVGDEFINSWTFKEWANSELQGK